MSSSHFQKIAVSETALPLLSIDQVNYLVDDALARPRTTTVELHYYHDKKGQRPTIVVILAADVVSVITEEEATLLKAELDKVAHTHKHSHDNGGQH
jgi:hypothetical protein